MDLEDVHNNEAFAPKFVIRSTNDRNARAGPRPLAVRNRCYVSRLFM